MDFKMGLISRLAMSFVALQIAVISFTLCAVSAQQFCNRTYSSNFTTRCTSCVRNKDVECPYSAEKLTTGRGRADCMYIVTLGESKIVQLAGCQHLCHRTAISVRCCSGYWGPQCEECPGGADNVCNQHGLCSQGIDGIGTCDCDENYTGTACELCANSTFYGQNCDQECQCENGTCNSGVYGDGSCDCFSGYTGDLCDMEIADCANLTCDNNSRCQDIDGNATCVCDHGYLNADNNTCTPINNCEDSPCHVYATCDMTGPAEHECTCISGYTGDGIYCEPVNPCQVDNGGCNVFTSVCVYMGPNKSACDCMAGYENYQPGVGCTLIDICSETSCHKNATCVTVNSNAIDCTCNEGFVGDGEMCYGNILQRLEDLNANDPDLYNQLTYALSILKAGYPDVLVEDGPFTIFVPVSQGFKQVFKEDKWDAILRNKDRMRQIIRQHIIVGQLSMDDLQNYTDYYTLQGVPLTLNVKRGGVFKYRLRGQSDKSKILKADLQCANGIIHITNTLITAEPEVVGSSKDNMMDLINKEGRYRRFGSYIQRLGIQNMFEAENMTIFVPNNKVFDEMPAEVTQYLMSADGQPVLRKIIRNHIFPGMVYVEELINKRRIISISNSAVNVSVRITGQIQLNGKVNVSQTDIPCSNGIYHHIEGLLIPADMGGILPRRCDVTSYKIVRGSCDVCYGDLNCPQTSDTPLKQVISGCRYWVNLEGQYVAYVGCSRMCNRTITRKRCCDGFYGEDCQSCPGGFQSPCGGRGKCYDGVLGNGTCICPQNFSGQSCQNCLQQNTWGPQCSQKCTCLNGVCDDGPAGTGQCRSGSCFKGFVGDNCDRKLTKCLLYHQLCHVYSECYQEKGNYFRCKCKPGYEGDGLNCREIDPCLKPDRGGCHPQASCTKVGPDMPKCQCDNGWVGDGFSCQPANPCYRNLDCGKNAVCRTFSIGEYHCACSNGFYGNGSYCAPSNSCIIDNGGCHKKANCISTGPGENNCTCIMNYGGNGYDCYSTIGVEVTQEPNLAVLKALMGKLEPGDNFLQQGLENYTFFAPSDEAMINYTATLPEDYFEDTENILSLLRFHTVARAYTTYNLRQMSHVEHKFDTFYDGYSLRIVSSNDSILIFNTQFSTARITKADIPALNGYIHMVDKVLEPFTPNSEQPDLDEFLSQKPEYSLFYKYLNDYGLVSTLEDDMGQYTLFAPSNTALQNLRRTVTVRLLQYYILPKLVFTSVLEDGQRESTVLGRDHPLVFTIRDGKVYVNNVPITETDRLTSGGVVQGIPDLLHPQLNRCDIKIYNTTKGPCEDCHRMKYTCPPGFAPVSGMGPITHQCSYTVTQPGGEVSSLVGCYRMCENTNLNPACCSGYYGPNCTECPSGPETPCNGAGLCKDGLDGTGECICASGFRGDDCGTCIDGLAGPGCNISINSCEYRNGNCSVNAKCTKYGDKVTCRCNDGFIGDGYICYSPCNTNNGGCHEKAMCNYSSNSVNCTCYSGYHGDGHTCISTFNRCAKDNGGCSPFAHCIFTPPAVRDLHNGSVTCVCMEGYVGDGRLCNKDIYSALSYLSRALRFFESLEYSRPASDNLTSLIKDQSQSVTVFVPIDESIDDLSMLNLPALENHIVNNSQVYLNLSMSLPLTLTSLDNMPLLVTRNRSRFQVNGVTIIKANIRALNGYIHLIQSPLWISTVGTSVAKAGSNVGFIVGMIILTVLLIGVVVVAIVMWRRSKVTGFMDVWRRIRKGSDSSLSFTRLQAQQSEDDSDAFTQPDNVNFDNPLYNSKD